MRGQVLQSGVFASPLWNSGFRPFFLIGAIYGPFLLWYWLSALVGVIEVDAAVLTASWHQHEMIFGFAFAIIIGFITTALPSWAKTDETEGFPLFLIFVCWCVGRLAFWWQGTLSPELVLICDQLLVPVILIVLLPKLLKAPQRRYLALVPILLGFWFGSFFYHLGDMTNRSSMEGFGLKLGLYAMIFLYHIVAGTLTPIFTETALRQAGCQVTYRFNYTIELLTVVSLLILMICDLAEFDGRITAFAALATAFIHLARMTRWKGLTAIRFPLIWTMQLAYLLLVVSFVLNALYQLQWLDSSSLWVHAFTVGALALKQLSILTRVALKHTGRPLNIHPLMVFGFVLAAIAVAVRLLVTLMHLGTEWLLLSGLLWSLPFVIWLCLYGRWMWQPSLPKRHK